ncbi:MAG: fructose-6-phosphate aldolase [Deltaproteobacteria bacterium RIFCSPLOWO2_02_56_12]|nr:MAG: fructose-6-phosphate aldolase [Deltaproteobacteria bacterium RIFCSPLOWO2_02_56_12]
MKFFIDSAEVQEIREAHSLGLIDGVTTNPSLIAKTGRGFSEVVGEICSLVAGPVSLETVSRDAAGMAREGEDLARYGKNVVVKVPLTTEGLKAVRLLGERGIKTNVTLCFSPVQALLAAKAGAAYVSPFVGRLDDISQSGMEVIGQIVKIYANYKFTTEVLVASIRHPIHVLTAALMGAHVATIPFAVIKQLAQHPLTDIGVEKFLKDWEKVPNKF